MDLHKPDTSSVAASPCGVRACALLGALLIAVSACGGSDSTAPVQEPGTPSGWAVSSTQSAEIGLENLTVHSGHFAGYIHGESSTSQALLTQAITGVALKGHRVRLTAWVNDSFLSNPAAVELGMFWQDTTTFSQVTIPRPIGGTDSWHQVSIVLDAPANLAGLTVGFTVSGAGQFFFDDVELAIVDSTTALSAVRFSPLSANAEQQEEAFYANKPAVLVNTDFEQGLTLNSQ